MGGKPVATLPPPFLLVVLPAGREAHRITNASETRLQFKVQAHLEQAKQLCPGCHMLLLFLSFRGVWLVEMGTKNEETGLPSEIGGGPQAPHIWPRAAGSPGPAWGLPQWGWGRTLRATRSLPSCPAGAPRLSRFHLRSARPLPCAPLPVGNIKCHRNIR